MMSIVALALIISVNNAVSAWSPGINLIVVIPVLLTKDVNKGVMSQPSTLICNDWTISFPFLLHLHDPCHEHSIVLPH